MTGRVTIGDCRPEFCVRGVRATCELLHIDFREFVRVGYPIDDLRDVSDPKIRLIVEKAKKRIASNGR